MSTFTPIVSVICPTTPDRAHLLPRMQYMFTAQDYQLKQLIIDDGEGSIGTKLNRLIDKSLGDVIVRCDSDDMYRPDWISKSVKHLMDSEADVTGLDNFYMANIENDWECYEYAYKVKVQPYVSGATMCFWKNVWRKTPFDDMSIGEDNKFLFGRNDAIKIVPHGYKDGFLATIHKNNTCPRPVHNAMNYRRLGIEEECIIRNRWDRFAAIKEYKEVVIDRDCGCPQV